MTFTRFSAAVFLAFTLLLGGCGGGGGTAPTGTDTPVVDAAPTVPGGLSAEVVSTTQINLTWEASTDDGTVTGYMVYQGGDVYPAYTTSYTATGLTPGTEYCFSVAALDDGGHTSSQSDAVCATTETAALSPWITVRSGTSATLSSAVWTGSTLLVVEHPYSNSGHVYSSPDGLTWDTHQSTGFFFDSAVDLIFDGTRYLAVENHDIFASPDGISWSSVDSNFSVEYAALAYSPTLTRYVAVGASGYITASEDGSDWNAVAAVPTTEHLMGAAWLNGRFYAIGDRETILTSTDGLTWTAAATPADSAALEDVAWNGSLFVATGDGTVLTSTDGDTWVEAATPPNAFNDAVVWGGGSANVFVTVGLSGRIYSSPDGNVWTRRFPNTDTTYVQLELHDVVWTGTRFVAVGQQGQIFTSDDGLEWRIVASGSDLNGIAHDGSHFIAVGGSGRIAVSDDADSWEYRHLGDDSYYVYDLAYGGGQYVAVGQQYGVYSNDLSSWDGYWTGGTSVDTAVLWDGTRFIRTGDYGIMTWDGVTTIGGGFTDPKWEWSYFSGTGETFNDLYWDNSTFVAVGYSGIVYTSPNAAEGSWSSRDSNTTNALKAVTKGNGRLVAVGLYSTVITSDDDGATWTPRYPVEDGSPYSIDYHLYDVTWTGTQFIAVGQAGMILTSDDGTVWSKSYHESYRDLHAILSRGADILIAGEAGTLIRNRL